MTIRVQKLVNAQLFVNRAVFEVNREDQKPSEREITKNILQAQIELSAALARNQYEKQQRKQNSSSTRND